MRRKPLNTTSRSKLTKYAKPLANLAVLLAESGSRLERRYWKKRLFAMLAPILEGRSDTTLNQTLEYLYGTHYKAYDELAFAIENTVESPSLGESEDLLLLAVPILAWSTYNIPSGKIEESLVAEFTQLIKSHVLSEHSHLVLTNMLFSPDQLPESYTAAAELARQLGQAALDRVLVRIDTENLPETQSFLSDVRYLIGVIAVPTGQPAFKWQEEQSNGSLLSKEDVLDKWRTMGSQALQKLMPGCLLELLLPNGLYNACREAEKEARAYSVRASAAFLESALDVPVKDIHASVGAFVERGEIEEYRIGFSIEDSPEIVHGVVWPLIGEEYGNEPDPVYEKDIQSEPDNPVIRSKIEALLKDVGIRHIAVLEERFPLEYCEDCGSPLYPNPEGELMHAELPEDSELPGAHLH
ncbi:DUF2863 family protein [Limnobacter litoralis]|uniref:DUF2863 domain-containing protein n=1 Tax=Limnobacter litoralis TaxID=481366 RepID=A0ABQ5YT84_9BURK|nr:DUF2863 family protein [Limnobacter litoralis]GLR26646.1 hypothetical protein GCM10007875_17360 [Limnobacter litoralis]